MSSGKVSVIIPSYNRSNRICYSVRSCFDQTYPDVEVIIVDDGSSDDTEQVVSGLKSLYGGKLIYHKQPNSGACIARNTGLSLATGEFIQFLDSDDLLHPDKFEIQVNALKDSAADVAVCDFEYVTEERKLIKTIRNDGDLMHKVSAFKSLSVFTPLIRRSSLPLNCRWNPEIKRNQDMDFMFRYFLTVDKWVYTPGVFCSYIFHGDERISDEYQKGIQYRKLVESAHDFLSSGANYIPSANKWMFREFSYSITRILSEQGRHDEARELVKFFIGYPFSSHRLKLAFRLLLKLDSEQGIRRFVPGFLLSIKRKLFPFRSIEARKLK